VATKHIIYLSMKAKCGLGFKPPTDEYIYVSAPERRRLHKAVFLHCLYPKQN